AESLERPEAALGVLGAAWLARRRTVVELAVDAALLREPERTERAPHEVGAGHDLVRERLAHVVWANAVDLRDGTPRWWHGELARRHAGAGPVVDGGPGDVRLSDGRAAWVDGGPRGPLTAALDGDASLPIVHRESVGLLGRTTITREGAPSGALADGLAADQLAAVTHRVGPARVIAPAGSGKTRVLAARLAHLVRDRGVEPELITAVAYNTRAAEELRTRVARLIGPGTRVPAVRTLHSLALSVVRLGGEREVIDEREVRSILARLVRLPRVPNQDAHAPWLEALAEVRLGLKDPGRVEEDRGDVDGFAEVFPRFRAALAERGVVDFDEQVHLALELLLSDPELRRSARRATTHLLVDEFQDLTPAFVLMVRLLAGPAQQVFAVGDDDQTIYGYAGADPRFLVDFDRWFPGAAHHALEVNHRCPEPVVIAASRLLGHNRVRVAKSIRAGRDAPEDPTEALERLALPASETARRVVTHIEGLLARGVAPSDVAVLARVGSALLPVQVALTEAAVGHGAPLGPTVLRRAGLRTALAYLRLATTTARPRREDLDDTLRRPARKLRSALQPLLARGRGPSLDELAAYRRSLEGEQRTRLDRYLDDITLLRAAHADGARTEELLRIVRRHIGLGDALDALDASRGRPEGSSHGDDLDALEQLALLEPDPARLEGFLTDRLGRPADPDGVVLSTVHRVKGMEWDHVVVLGVDAGRFPHRLAEDLEEERRVLHVALTRARVHCLVVSDLARPSPFLTELDRDAPPPTSTTTSPSPAPSRSPSSSRSGAGRSGTRPTGAPDRARSQEAGRDALDAHGLARFEALRAWRATTARGLGVPAYVVASDRTLQDIALHAPRDLTGLAACHGIGPAKLERFGDDLLAVVADAAPSTDTPAS
ncbi:MAG: hypothetical protein RLZZ272_1091, partial [Actinomycetota bacterium]